MQRACVCTHGWCSTPATGCLPACSEYHATDDSDEGDDDELIDAHVDDDGVEAERARRHKPLQRQQQQRTDSSRGASTGRARGRSKARSSSTRAAADGAAGEGPPPAGGAALASPGSAAGGRGKRGGSKRSRSRSSADSGAAISEGEEALDELEEELYRDPDTDSEDEYDDADDDFYNRRVAKWQAGLASSSSRQARRAAAGEPSAAADGQEDEEAMEDEEADVEFEGGLVVPGRVYGALFDYQRTAVKWLWELHQQRAGGILGDEMGLGKVCPRILNACMHASKHAWSPTPAIGCVRLSP